MESGSQWGSDSHPDSGWAPAHQESELAWGSALALDSGFQSESGLESESALESESQLGSDSELVSALVSGSPQAPDSVTYSAPQPD